MHFTFTSFAHLKKEAQKYDHFLLFLGSETLFCTALRNRVDIIHYGKVQITFQIKCFCLNYIDSLTNYTFVEFFFVFRLDLCVCVDNACKHTRVLKRHEWVF